ncbi:MAG TPA: class I SAM-dependent methyltransferase [Blastocatellia bacterium]|nr:class I SAM-dependent methyltransferase [Blastocatellia bacterium]
MNPQSQTTLQSNRIACDVCGSLSVRELYTAKDRLRNGDLEFKIAECRGCGVLQTLPEMSDAELARYYPDDYWGVSEPTQKWIESSQSEKTRFLSRCGLPEGKILDVGCGSGFFLRALDAAKWDRFGVETSVAAVRTAERAIGSGHVFAGTLTQSTWADSTFDVVTFWSALEHTNEPRANLREAKRIIKPGGSLIVQAPNAASYQARFFGGDWFALDAPRHRYHFTLSLLERLLSEIGFEIYRVTYFSKAHNSHALRQSLKAKLLTSDSSPISHALFYVSLPFVKPFDSVMSALGKGATLTVAARAV